MFQSSLPPLNYSRVQQKLKKKKKEKKINKEKQNKFVNRISRNRYIVQKFLTLGGNSLMVTKQKYSD